MIIIGGITLGILLIYNWIQTKKINDYEEQINNKTIQLYSIPSLYNNKLIKNNEYRIEIYKKLEEAYGKEQMPSMLIFNNKIDLEKDYPKKIFENLVYAYGKTSFPSDTIFYENLRNPLDEEDLKNIKNRDQIKNEIKTLKTQKNRIQQSIIKKEDYYFFTQYILLFSLFIFFIGRYLIYGLLWSIKTLKSEK